MFDISKPVPDSQPFYTTHFELVDDDHMCRAVYDNHDCDAVSGASSLFPIQPQKQMVTIDDFETMTVAELNDWYQAQVGYRPQDDDPSMTQGDLFDLCVSYAQAVGIKTIGRF